MLNDTAHLVAVIMKKLKKVILSQMRMNVSLDNDMTRGLPEIKSVSICK